MVRFDYSSLADDYDRKRYEGKGKYADNYSLDCLFTLLPSTRPLKVLDVGCGTGRGVVALSEMSFDVIGVDFTMEMLLECKRKLKNPLRVKLIRSDANDLPFANDSVECIITLNFLHLFPDEQQKRFVDEMARILRPGGTLICEFDNYYRGLVAGRRTLKENPTLNLNRLSDVAYLFSNPWLHVDQVRGNVLPYLWRLFQFFPALGRRVNRLAYIRPFADIAPRFLVKAVKK